MACYDQNGNEIPCADWYAQHNVQVALTNQQGSQQWMSKDPYGVGTVLTAANEPTLAQKMLMTDNGSAEYARDWVTLSGLTSQLGTYPNPSQNSVEIYYQNDAVRTRQTSLPAAAQAIQSGQSLESGFDISGLYPILIGAGALVLAVSLFGGRR
jgi:hypothetical protein